MKHITLHKCMALCALAALFMLFAPSTAQASFVVPKRVMIDEGQRTGVLTIYNRTDTAMTYSFSWERRGQTADGENVLLEPGQTLPGYKPADEMLILSPRQVLVPPGQSQKVRIMVRRPANLAPGEYLSHILIKPEPVRSAGESAPTQGFGGSLQMRTYLSLPIFVRHGKTQIDFDIAQAALTQKDGKNIVRLSINNNSTRSLYSRPKLECTQANGTVVAETVKTLRMYSQAKRFTYETAIPAKMPPLNTCQSLKVKFYGLQDFEYGQNLIKEVSVQR